METPTINNNPLDLGNSPNPNNNPIPEPNPNVPPINHPAPPSTPDTFEKGGVLTDKQFEMAQILVLSVMIAAFTYQIYYYRKKIIQYNRITDLEDRVKKLEQKI